MGPTGSGLGIVLVVQWGIKSLHMKRQGSCKICKTNLQIIFNLIGPCNSYLCKAGTTPKAGWETSGMRLIKLNVRDAGNTPPQGSSGRNSLKTQVQEGGKRGEGCNKNSAGLSFLRWAVVGMV